MTTHHPIWIFVLVAGTAALAENVDPADDGSRYAWAENAGWINAEPAGDGGPGMQVGDFDVSGWLWGENLGWISLSCANAASCDAAPYAVANDGDGNLSGWAWAEHGGWIDFAPQGGGVVIDPATGIFSGNAWGENIGWISFASSGGHFALRTGWTCDPAPALPAGPPALTVTLAGTIVVLDWTSVTGATAFDVVLGDLGALVASGGDFASAVEECLADNYTEQVAAHENVDGPGEGTWYLVRGVNCGGGGTWDSGGIGQQGARGPGIQASPSACP